MDLQMGCVLNPPDIPDPEPPPVEGVKQITFEEAYYEGLMWSPSGKYLLAKKCEHFNRAAECSYGHEFYLIDLDTREHIKLSFDDVYPGASGIKIYPYLWASNRDFLLLSLSASYPATPDTSGTSTPGSSTSERGIYLYDVTSGDHQALEDLGGFPIAWLENENAFLLHEINFDPDTEFFNEAFTWLNYETKERKEEVQFTGRDFAGRTELLSPDRTTILLGDDLSLNSCRGLVIEYRIGSGELPEPSIEGACFVRYSPKGGKIAYSKRTQGDIWPRGVWIADADGTNPVALFAVDKPSPTSSIAWSSDGAQIAFTYGYHYNAIHIMDVPKHLQD
jgi:hypothetical protein